MDFTKTIIPLAVMASESITHSADSEPIWAQGIIVNMVIYINVKSRLYLLLDFSCFDIDFFNWISSFKS